MTERYLEDFTVGQTFGSGRLRIPDEAPVMTAQRPKQAAESFMTFTFGNLGRQDGKHSPKATSSLGDPLI